MIDLGPFLEEKSILGYDDHRRFLLSVRMNELAMMARPDMRCCLTESGSTRFQGIISDVKIKQDHLFMALKEKEVSS